MLHNLNFFISKFLNSNFLEMGVKIFGIIVFSILIMKLSNFFTKRLRLILEANSLSNNERLLLRAKTISEILNNLTIVFIGIIAVILIIGELGINIAPIIAGAGVLGLAVSFGAQNVVKDVISGFFILLEDQYGIDDIIKTGGMSGKVENINLRTTILRDTTGNVHIIPNGEIKQVTVMTKSWAKAVIDIKVPRNTELNNVFNIINEETQKVCEELEDIILEPAEILGVESIELEEITIRTTIKTKPAKQWDVSRECKKRIINRLFESNKSQN